MTENGTGRRGRPPGTSRASVVATARRILEAEGADALTMRRVAAELGVAPAAIYRFVGSREAVVAAVVDELTAEMRAITPRGRTPRARVKSIALAIRAEVQAHPYLVDAARQLGRGPASNFPGQVALARELTAAGLSGEAAADALRSIAYVVGGFILIEDLDPEPTPTTTQDLWRELSDSSVEPGLAAAMSKPPDLEELLSFTLDRLLDALLPD